MAAGLRSWCAIPHRLTVKLDPGVSGTGGTNTGVVVSSPCDPSGGGVPRSRRPFCCGVCRASAGRSMPVSHADRSLA